jgi:ribonuclease HI
MKPVCSMGVHEDFDSVLNIDGASKGNLGIFGAGIVVRLPNG